MSVIGGVTVSRNRAIKIDLTYLLTYLFTYCMFQFPEVLDSPTHTFGPRSDKTK